MKIPTLPPTVSSQDVPRRYPVAFVGGSPASATPLFSSQASTDPAQPEASPASFGQKLQRFVRAFVDLVFAVEAVIFLLGSMSVFKFVFVSGYWCWLVVLVLFKVLGYF